MKASFFIFLFMVDPLSDSSSVGQRSVAFRKLYFDSYDDADDNSF